MIKNLRTLRKKKGISQQALAVVIGISQQSVNKYENHDVEPDISTLIKIADYFDVTIDYLVGREEDNYAVYDAKESGIDISEKYNSLTKKEKDCIDMIFDVFDNPEYIN